MNDNRYPKLCFVKFRSMALADQSITDNWFTHINTIITSCPAAHFWTDSGESLSLVHLNTILFQFKQLCYDTDTNSLHQSTSLQMLSTTFPTIEPSPYLLLHLPLHSTRILAQLRFINNFNPRIITDKVCKFDYTENCRCCFSEEEDLTHFLCTCTVYSELRQKYFGSPQPSPAFWSNCLSNLTRHTAEKLVRYVRAALTLRENF